MTLRIVAPLAVLGGFPLVGFRHLPIQDHPNVLAIVATLVRSGTPSFDRYFATDWSFGPYTAFYALAYGLASILGADAAVRLAIAIPMIGVPIATAALARRLSGDGTVAGLLTIPLLYTEIYFVGFHPFLWSWFLALLGAYALARYLPDERATALVLAALAFVASFLAHPSASMSFLATSGVVFVLASGSRSARIRAAVVLGTLVALSLLWVRATQDVDVSTPTITIARTSELRYHALLPAFAVTSTRDAPAALGIVVAATYGLVVLGRALVALRDDRRARLACLVPASLALLSLYLPFGAGPVVWLDTRVALAAFVAALLLGRSLPRWERRETIAATSVVLVVLAFAGLEHVRFEREMRPLDRIAARIPRDSGLVGLTYSRTSEAFVPPYLRDALVPTFSLFTHVAASICAERGGFTPTMTFHPSLRWIPLRFRDPSLGRRFPITSPFLPNRTLRALASDARGIAFVLVRRIRPEHREVLERFAEPVATEGRFTLFRVRSARPVPNAEGLEPREPRVGP